MAISYDALDGSIERRAACEGISVELAAIRTFALMVMAVAVDIPVSLRPALVAGVNRWLSEVGAVAIPHRIWEGPRQNRGFEAISGALSVSGRV